LALTSPTISERSVSIIRPRTKATEFSFSFSHLTSWWVSRFQLLSSQHISVNGNRICTLPSPMI
jgi:hypothetical protein